LKAAKQTFSLSLYFTYTKQILIPGRSTKLCRAWGTENTTAEQLGKQEVSLLNNFM